MTGVLGMKKNRVKASKEIVVFNAIGYVYISILALFCLIPFLMVVSGSFTDENSIINEGYRLIPEKLSLEAYKLAFGNPMVIFRAYFVTIFVTLIGTTVSLFFTSMAAYALQRKDFRYRNFFAFFFYFTSIFNGGLVPWYILMVKYLGMKNSYLALIVPMLFNMFNMIIIRSFMSTIPESISESAKIDGASDFRIFLQLILPLSKPVLATIGLFIALGYWNDWYLAMLFIDKEKMYPLQFFLYRLLSKIDFLKNIAAKSNTIDTSKIQIPSEGFKLAMTVIVTGPIIFLYPYLQKYFIKGVMIGAVKG